jgi:hypothetical protein
MVKLNTTYVVTISTVYRTITARNVLTGHGK